jgi:galactokinase
MTQQLNAAREEFLNIFGEEAEFYGTAPGRVEVLGNHTDYNDGFALAAAIDRSIVVAGRPIPGDTAKIYSLTFKSGSSFKVDAPEYSKNEHWLNYVMSVVWQFRRIGMAPGAFEAVVAGDVPLGAGLSSSAALEMATGNFLKAMLGFEMGEMDMAQNCRAAENGFVGVQCGILDQWSSAMGREGRLLLLDCRKLEVLDYPALPERVELVIADTNAPHALMAGDYNRRRESCFRAAAVCAEKFPDRGITHLRDVSLEELESCRDSLSDEDFRRARHIVTENQRTLVGAEALRVGDLAELGRLFNDSHASSRVNFENSGPELDAMAGAATGLPGCYGSRLTGGGFGGATVNLVETSAVEEFCRLLKERYTAATGMKGETHALKPSLGARGGKF